MIEDLNEIYDTAGAAAGEQEPDPGKKPKVNPGDAYLQQRKQFPQNMSRAGASFKVEGVTPSDQTKFFGETGIYDPALTGQNIALEAGERQTVGNKIARRLGNIVPNIAANLVDIVGSIGSAITEWGDERDYQNGLTELADSMKNPAGENYKRSNDTWALSDPTWWIDNAFNTVEYAAAYGIAGVGTGVALRGLVQGSQWLSKAAQLGTSAFMSYAQGASSGATVFKEVYETQFNKNIAKGLSPDEAAVQAKHTAAQSAATTAQLSTLLTMGINSGAYAPIFRSQEALSRDIIASRLVGLERTSFGEIARMIRGTSVNDYKDRLMHHSGMLGVLNEMWREGGEEVLQQFAERTGTDIGNKGQIKNFIQQFGEIENLVDRSANAEGLLAFTLGAAFGGLQHGLIHNVIPSKYVEKLDPTGNPIQKMTPEGPMVDKQGNPVFEKHWITPRQYENDFTQKSFNSVRDAVAHDFERVEALKDEFLAARKAGNPIKADAARDEMFDAGKLYAVKSGTKDAWIKTFEHIAEMAPADAVAAGYAMNEQDESYKQKAQEAITDINHLQQVYDGLEEQYSTRYRDVPGLRPLVDMVFARQANLYSGKKRIDAYRKELEADEAKESQLAQITDPTGLNQLIANQLRAHSSATEVERQLIADSQLLDTAIKNKDVKSVDKLLKKYRAIGYGDGNYMESVKDLHRKLLQKQQEMVTKVETAQATLLAQPEYQAWLAEHPGGSFDQYLKEANERTHLFTQNRFRRAQLEQAQVEHDIAQRNLADMTSEKSALKFARKAEEWRKQMIQQAEEMEARRAAKIADMTKDKTTMTRLERMTPNRIAAKYRSRLDAVNERIAQLTEDIKAWKAELAVTHRDPVRSSALNRLIKNGTRELEALRDKAAVLESLFRTYAVEEVEEDLDEDEVTGKDNGKDTMDTAEGVTTNTKAVADMDADEFLQELMGTGEAAEMSDAPTTIEDELAALQKDIEESSPIDYGTDPIEDYKSIFNGAHKNVQQKLGILVDGMMSGEIGFSLDALNPEIQAGHISRKNAHAALIAAREYVAELQRIQAVKETGAATGEHFKTPSEQPQVLVEDVAPPDTPPLETDPEVSGTIPEGLGYHAGFKIVHAAHTGATATIGYEEGTKRDKDGKLVYTKVTKPDELLKPVVNQILRPGQLLPGHPLIYEVDVDYNGPKHITDSLSWDENGAVVQETERAADYLGADGKVKASPAMIGNVPIRVRDGVTGEFLFHIRKMDWVNAKFPGTTDYRNVVENTEEDKDNIGTQRRLLLALRTAIVERFNADGSASEGKMAPEGKGTGRLILNHVVESKDADTLNIKSKVQPKLAWNRAKPEESLLPDASLELVIVAPGNVVQSGRDFQSTKPLGFDTDDLVPGGVGALVPAVNGQYMYAPLIGMKLYESGKPSPALASVARAIELYILNDGSDPSISAEIESLERNTNFNVGSAQGLRAFINQYYTYLQGFKDSALSANNSSFTSEQFVFDIDVKAAGIADKTKQIKVGFTRRGRKATYANLVNGQLSADFMEILTEGFSQRSRAVVYTDQALGIKGINSSGSFTDAVYVPGKGWKHNEYDSYNQYVKSFSKTPVYGRNQLSDGTYVYTANPHLNITPPVSGAKPVQANTTVNKVNPPAATQTDLDADAFDLLGNFSIVRTGSTTQAIGTAPEDSQPLTLATLQEKYNFTPEAQRNGKTVLEVLGDLTGRGHTFLPEGYNPFSRCL